MKPFFSFNDDNGILFHDTAEEAKAAALAELEHYRDEANHDGEWTGAVEGVRWGQVLGMSRAVPQGGEPESFDYELADVKPNTTNDRPPVRSI